MFLESWVLMSAFARVSSVSPIISLPFLLSLSFYYLLSLGTVLSQLFYTVLCL